MILCLCLFLSINLELRNEVSVSSHKVYVKDLISVSSLSVLKKHGLDRIPIGFVPPAGQSKSINRSFIEGVLSREGVAISWSGAKSCQVSRKTQKVPAEHLNACISEWLLKHAPRSGQYSLERVQAPLPHNLPSGSLKFAIYSAAKSLRPGRNILRIDTYVNEVKKQSFAATITLSLEVMAARTMRNLMRGDLIQADDVIWETIKTDRMLAPLVTKNQLLGCQARVMIPSGTVLDWRKIEKAPLIKRNQLIYVNAVNGALSIRMQAKSLDRGGIGETVRLKNLDSGKMFLATVTGMGTAQLNL